MKIKAITFESFLAFLLGLSVCEGITTILSVGSTIFTFSEVISPIIFIFLVIKRSNTFLNFLRNIPLGFKLFFLLIIFSVFPCIARYGFDSIYRFLVGFIYLILVFTMAANVYLLKEHKSSMLNGLTFGLGINLLYSLICYVAFNLGTTITLEGVFDREGFYTPTLLFRTQGFFLEPSHFIRFVAAIFLIVIVNRANKNVWLKLFWYVIAIFVLVQTFSGSIVILAIGVVFYFLVRKNKPKKQIKASSLFIVFLVAILCLLVTNQELISSFDDAFLRIITGADITDEGNAARFDSMKIVLEHFDVALLGCGWNQMGTLIEENGLHIVSAFSDLLEMTMEVGVVGSLIYIISVFSLAIKLIKIKTASSVAIAVSILMIFALQIGTDYAFNTCIMFVFGLAVCELVEKKERRLRENED